MRSGWSVAACVAVLLAGCASGPVDDTGPDGAGTVLTEPKDYSYLENATDGSGYHVHDYWRGQDQLTLMESTHSCLQCSSSSIGGGSVEMASFRPDPDHVVPQGTAWVHVTASWSVDEAESQFADVRLFVKTAADQEPQEMTVLESGVAMRFESTHAQNDPPHHILSLWEFALRATPIDDESIVEDWTVDIAVSVERGLEIPEYPPHPDLWQGNDALTLLETTMDATRLEVDDPQGGRSVYCFTGCLGVFHLDDGAVVPFDAGTLQVIMEFDPTTTPTANLAFHGADTWDMAAVEPTESTTHRFVYDIDLDSRMTDSPYALQSLWEFHLSIDQPTPIRLFEGEFAVTVTARKA